MWKWIFELLTDPLNLPIAWYWDYLIMAGLGIVAYFMAYAAVGALYRNGEISGREAGSLLHWGIRLIIFVALWAISNGLIALVKWLCHYWVIVVSVLGGLTAVVIAIVAIQCVRNKRGAKSKNAKDER